MKSTEISILSWGIYLIGLGLALICIPINTVALFGFESSEDLWIRFAGILSVVLGIYYIQVAKNRIKLLYKWKIVGHVFGLVCMGGFIVSGVADLRLMGTIVVELSACLWTFFALKWDYRNAEKQVLEIVQSDDLLKSKKTNF